MFQEDDVVYHERYGIGKIVSVERHGSKVEFELKDDDLPATQIKIIKNNEIYLLGEVMGVGSRVKNSRFGYGTILQIITAYGITQFLVEFDEKNHLLHRIYIGEDDESILKRNRLWCVPKYDEYDGFKIVDDTKISSVTVLENIYENVRQDLPGKEKEFLSNVRRQDLNLLDRILTLKIKKWAFKKKYGGRKNG